MDRLPVHELSAVNGHGLRFKCRATAETVRLDAYLRSVPELLSRSGKKLRRAVKDKALASVALQRLLETGQVIEFKYKKQRLCLHSSNDPKSQHRKDCQATNLLKT